MRRLRCVSPSGLTHRKTNRVPTRDEIKYTFDVSKCNKLFKVLLKGGVIWLAEGHVMPSVEYLAKKKYCKWHDSYSHTTNECKYFHR
jgi:hypothetical protein